MAPIHLPDGAFSIQFLIFWWILVAVLITTTILITRRQTIAAERLNIAVMLAAASFAIFQTNLPFAGGALADYNAHTKRARQCGKLVM